MEVDQNLWYLSQTVTLWNPYLDMFAQKQGANMQIHKYKHGLKDTLTPSTSVPKLIWSESQISSQSVISIHIAGGINENMLWC